MAYDKFGTPINVGDKVVYCYRGYFGKDADLRKGTIEKITNYGVWIKPDSPAWLYCTNSRGQKWSTFRMVVKLS
jgi:hypothetical protein